MTENNGGRAFKMKNISVIGVGKLGLCFSLTLEEAGYNVLGVDINEQYVSSLNKRKYLSNEPGVDKHLRIATNFEATMDLKRAVDFSDFLYTVVATPSLPNGEYDHSQVDSLVKKLIQFGPQKSKKYLVICCTTMPEYCDFIQEKLESYNYEVCYNPEFIAQGTILRDQLKPDMVLIGESSKLAGDLIQEHYERMTENEPTFCRMSRTEAEICKISLNCFLTTKISFANMVGDICVKAGANPDTVLKAVGSDSRISNKYLGFGYGYGGPCFPRDNRALAKYALSKGVDALVSKASDDMNTAHIVNQFDDFVKSNPNKEKEVVFDYVTYKPQTTILEESQQLKFAVMLAKAGYNVVVKERNPVVKELKARFGDLFFYEKQHFNTD